MGQRTPLLSLAGRKVEDVPGKSDPLLLDLPLDQLVPTRFNPRRNFGTDEDLRDFGEKLVKEQLAPVVVVSRSAYLKLWPAEADNVGTVPYVIANGERRFHASLLVGRETILAVHRETVAASKAEFLDAVQSENNDRKDLDPIERALGIDTMVAELGGSLAVAEFYGKTKAWVSQQRKLLKLTLKLQDLVIAGEMPLRVARDIAGLPPEEQAAAWQAELKRRDEPKPPKAKTGAEPRVVTAVNDSTRETAPPGESAVAVTAVNDSEPEAMSLEGATAVVTAVNDPRPDGGGPSETGSAAQVVTAVNDAPPPGQTSARASDVPTVTVQAETIPEQQAGPAEIAGVEGKSFPYDDGVMSANLLIRKMATDEEFFKMMDVLNATKRRTRTAD